MVMLMLTIFTSVAVAQTPEPTQITTIEQLNSVRNDLDGDYVLMNNLDFADGPITYRPQSTSDATVAGPAADATNAGFPPIGGDISATRFTGTFDGNGFTISNLYINVSSANALYAGLFAYLDASSEVLNLGLLDVYVKGEGTSNSPVYVGGVTARSNTGSTITNCYVTGDVTGTGTSSTDLNTGGLVGESASTITNCYATVTTSGAGTTSYVGGLVGFNFSNIRNSYATGTATGTATGNNRVGGLVGGNNRGITNSYATGNVTGTGNLQAGGLVGLNNIGTVTNSYATGNVTGTGGDVGGLVGFNGYTITNSFWDKTTTTQSTSAGSNDASGLTTAEMKMLTAMGTADMEADRWKELDWDFGDGTKFPTLRSYEGTEDNQIQGFIFCDQPTDYVSCDTETIALRGVPVDFGARAAATTLQLVITGRNLSGAVTLTTTMPFSFEGGGLTTTVPPNSNEFISTSIPITLTPTTEYQDLTSMVTISGGGLTSEVEIALTGIAIPLLADGDGDNLLEISYIEQLSLVRNNSGEDYELLKNLDFDSDDSYASGVVNNAYRPLDKADPTDTPVVVKTQANAGDGLNPGWVPIGAGTNRFTGTFDGNGFTITNLYINATTNNVGLFGAVGGAGSGVRNLELADAYVKGAENTGGLVGDNSGTINNCHITAGTVTGTGNRVGGLAGQNNNTVTNSSATGTVSGTNTSVGGLVGQNNNSTIRNCYATATVSGSGSSGGLVGNFQGGSIHNCYATGNTTVTNGDAGGLVGLLERGGNIMNCYATGAVSAGDFFGGLTGHNESTTMTNCYTTAGIQITASSSTARLVNSSMKTTAELKAFTATSASWDENNWAFGDNTKFPTLRTYEGVGDDQVQGFIICDQPTDYVLCDEATIALLGFPIDFGARATATTLPLVITGRNLNGDITLTTTTPFSFEGGSLTTTTITPANEFINTSIPITLTPTANYQAHTSTVMISGGGAPNVEVALTGISIPPLADSNGDGLLEINYIEQLNLVRNDLDGDYELVRNLDFNEDNSYASGAINNVYRPLDKADPTDTPVVAKTQANAGDGLNPGFVPIATFTGTFEGNGFTITNLYINKTGNAGLFISTAGSASIRNLGLINVYIKSPTTVGSSIGTLVGYKNGGTITNCYASGTINAPSTSTTLVGGLVGFNNVGAIINSFASTNVSNTTDSGTKDLGGLVGRNSSTISNSYATGTATGAATGANTNAGGLVGQNNSGGTISNSYATGAVSGAGTKGGLVGSNNSGGTISNSYATGAVSGAGTTGGLGGSNSGTITNSFWDKTTTTQTSSAGSDDTAGLTTADLKMLTAMETATTPTDQWSTNNWDFGDNTKFPTLRSYEGSGDTQVQGFILCDQPADHLPCDEATIALRAHVSSIDFGARATAITLPLAIAGRNLNGAITLSASHSAICLCRRSSTDLHPN